MLMHHVIQKKIRVLVIDDSALVRKTITDTLSMDPDIEVVGVANDPLIAISKIPKLNPDVLTLDMEMPRMDGLTYLRMLKDEGSTIPVVVISSLTQQGSKMALAAMEAGAREVLAKPDGTSSIGALAGKLAYHIKAAAKARRDLEPLRQQKTYFQSDHSSLSTEPDRRLIVIGASTGGVEALRYILPSLPANLPPIAVVQHIPAYFSNAVATRINDMSEMNVREARDEDVLVSGTCLIAPGDHHMMVVKKGTGYQVRLLKTPPVHHCRPAVDILFRSASTAAGLHTVAVLLTGMGSDGARGLQAIKQSGGCSLAQDEASCIIYGMPRAAMELGVVDQSVHLQAIPKAIIETLKKISA